MLTNIVVKQTYVGNGIQTVFPIPYDIIVNGSSETKVYRRNELVSPATTSLLSEGVDYTLTGGSPPTDVTMTTAPATGHKLVVTRVLPLTQIIDYIANSTFDAESHELGMDRLDAMIQQLQEAILRAPRLPITTPITDFQMPEPVANGVWAWNSAGTALEYLTLSGLNLINNNFTAQATGSLQWLEDGISPTPDAENFFQVYKYAAGLDAIESQGLYSVFKVPANYESGLQINLKMGFYSAGAGDVTMRTQATLYRPSVSNVTLSTDQHVSTNATVAVGAGDVNEIQSIILDLTDGSGLINGTLVLPGDYIRIRLYRDNDVGVDASVLVNASELVIP